MTAADLLLVDRAVLGVQAFEQYRPDGVPPWSELPTTAKRAVLAMILKPGDRRAAGRARAAVAKASRCAEVTP